MGKKEDIVQLDFRNVNLLVKVIDPKPTKDHPNLFQAIIILTNNNGYPIGKTMDFHYADSSSVIGTVELINYDG